MARAASELPGTEIPDADGRRRVVIERAAADAAPRWLSPPSSPRGASSCSGDDTGAGSAAALDPAVAKLMAAHHPRPHCADSDLQVAGPVDPPRPRLRGLA